MRGKIFLSSLLVLTGILLGWWLVINWQLWQEIKRTETAAAADSQALGKIEEYLTKNFVKPAADSPAK